MKVKDQLYKYKFSYTNSLYSCININVLDYGIDYLFN